MKTPLNLKQWQPQKWQPQKWMSLAIALCFFLSCPIPTQLPFLSFNPLVNGDMNSAIAAELPKNTPEQQIAVNHYPIRFAQNLKQIKRLLLTVPIFPSTCALILVKAN